MTNFTAETFREALILPQIWGIVSSWLIVFWLATDLLQVQDRVKCVLFNYCSWKTEDPLNEYTKSELVIKLIKIACQKENTCRILNSCRYDKENTEQEFKQKDNYDYNNNH